MFPSVWQQLSLTSSAQGQSESQAVSRDALGPDNPLPMSLHFSSGCPGSYSAAGFGDFWYRG